jgi:hypothetical protein
MQQLRAFAEAICRSLKVNDQEALDRCITPLYAPDRLNVICDQLRRLPEVAEISNDREWDNIFSLIVKVKPKRGTIGKEELFLWGRLSQVFPIACCTWMVTNSESVFATFDPPQTIIQSYSGPLSPELGELESLLQDVLRVNGYLVAQPNDLNFSVGEPLAQQTAERRQITGTSFFFGWDFLRK